MNKNTKLILTGICIAILLFNIFLILKNPDCPFHVDYVQYTKSINTFYDNGVLSSSVNGKYLYVYLMAIILIPFNLLSINLYNGMVFITGLFQILIIYLFYRYTKSILKTILMSTSLIFLTFIGHAETAIISSVFLLLYFIYRDKPYSEFFITIASFIRIDSAIYYLFARKKTAIIPIAITFFQWLSRRYFVESDLGFNIDYMTTFSYVILGYGMYLCLFFMFGKPKGKKYDWLVLVLIVLFLTFFLRFPSQKIFLFPVILSFMFYDFNFRKFHIKWVIVPLIIINIVAAGAVQLNRSNLCTVNNLYDYSEAHDSSIFYGVFQPYLDYRGKHYKEPYDEMLTMDCINSTDYLMAEDWRDWMLLYLPYKYCLKDYDLEGE